MGFYRYLAQEAGDPTPREILVEADTASAAAAKLRGRHATPVRYLGTSSGEDELKGFSQFRRKKADPFLFTRQLAPLLESYIPLERALAIIEESTEDEQQKDFVNSLRQGLHEGKKFSELIRSHGRLFPGYYANLIESGEETGCLPEVVKQLQQFMSESRELKEFIVSSSIYPLAILFVTLCVTVLLFTVFVPRFAKIFQDMGRAMPPSMTFLLGMSSFASWAWWLIPLLLTGGWYGAKKYWGEEQLKRYVSRFMIWLPLFGKIIINLEMCKYIRTLAILVSNHVEIIRTVKISGKIIVNPVIADAFSDIGRKLKGGAKLSAALTGNPYIPSGTVPMLRVGEESGEVGRMLERIATNLETDTRTRIKRLLSLFEPAVIIFLAGMVMVVVVSIFVAMMEINSINQGGPGI